VILQEVFPSSEMADYLAECTLNRDEIRDAIAYAAIPLERKQDMFFRV